MQMILVQLILNKIQNHLSQCRLGVQLDLCISGALSPSRHSSNDRYRFRARGTTGFSILDHDLGHLSFDRRIQMSGHSDFRIF